MKRQSVLHLLLALLAATQLSGALGANQAIEATVRGEVRKTEAAELVLQGELEGDLRGTLRVTVAASNPGRTSGHWLLTIFSESADGSRTEVGTLRGNVTDGAFVIGPGDLLVGLSGVKLTVLEGTDGYADAADGSGQLDVQLGRDNEPFSAKVALTF